MNFTIMLQDYTEYRVANVESVHLKRGTVVFCDDRGTPILSVGAGEWLSFQQDDKGVTRHLSKRIKRDEE